MNNPEINVGIDTSSKQLDIYVRPTGHFFSVNNEAAGIKDAVKQLQALKPTRVLIESTGRLELDFVIAAHMTIRVMPSECRVRSHLLSVFMSRPNNELYKTRPWVAAQGGSQFTRLTKERK